MSDDRPAGPTWSRLFEGQTTKAQIAIGAAALVAAREERAYIVRWLRSIAEAEDSHGFDQPAMRAKDIADAIEAADAIENR